jgi:hypothetical protein
MMPPKPDAFASLSIGGGGSGSGSSAVGGMGRPILSMTQQPAASKADENTANNKTSNAEVNYEEKQVVCYKSNGKRFKAQIVKKHLDDELDPFYTIVLPFGKEKQTDSAHLEPLEAAFERIEEKLLSFSAAQLQQVENFLSNLSTNNSALPSIASASPSRPPTMGINNTVPPPVPASMSMMNRASSCPVASTIPSPISLPAPNITGQATNQAPAMQQPPQSQGQMQVQNQAPQMMMQQSQPQQLNQMGQFQQQPMQGHQPPQMQMQGQVGGQQPQMMMMQQQPMQGQQPPQMQGQVQQPPQIQMQQQPMQAEAQPQQIQGQMGGQPPQMMMQQQAMQGQQPQMMMQQQQPMQGQNPPQMGQAQPPAPQGNPFDMY